MEKSELLEIIHSIKYDTLDKYTIYFAKASIGDTATVFHQREMLKALSIYIQALDYFYTVYDGWEDIEVTAVDVNKVIAKAISLLRTFKTRYYG